jgi:hypothetical protein
MSVATRLALAGLLAGVLGSAAPSAAADLCLQFDGPTCPLSGDLGFFRFPSTKLPKNAKKAVALHGRACGTGTVTGTAVRNPAGTLIQVGATFLCDATPGLISADIDPANTAVGSTHDGDAGFGSFDLNASCTVTIADCAGEPGQP